MFYGYKTTERKRSFEIPKTRFRSFGHDARAADPRALFRIRRERSENADGRSVQFERYSFPETFRFSYLEYSPRPQSRVRHTRTRYPRIRYSRFSLYVIYVTLLDISYISAAYRCCIRRLTNIFFIRLRDKMYVNNYRRASNYRLVVSTGGANFERVEMFD